MLSARPSSMSEKFLLKWNEFHGNISENYKELRQDSDFSDVTLACEGNQQFNVHKLILSASSQVFKEMIVSYNKSNTLIYLRGITANDLSSIIDFIYFGQANVYQEDLESFLALAEEFKIKGLYGKPANKSTSRTDQENTIPEEQEKCLRNVKHPDTIKKQLNSSKSKQHFPSCRNSNAEPNAMIAEEQENHATNIKQYNENNGQSDSLISQETVKEEIENEILDVYNTETIDFSMENTLLELEEVEKKMESMLEKRVSGWTCKVCEKVSVRKDNLKKHTEVHIEGIKRPCLTCGKIFKSRDSLSVHRAASHRAAKQ